MPDIVPVVVSNDKPAGSPGLMVQLDAAPPLFDGTQFVIAAPTVYVLLVGE